MPDRNVPREHIAAGLAHYGVPDRRVERAKWMRERGNGVVMPLPQLLGFCPVPCAGDRGAACDGCHGRDYA